MLTQFLCSYMYCQISYVFARCSGLTEIGRMCLVKCADENLKIFLIEINGDSLLKNNGRHQRFQIFTEWASRGVSSQRFYDFNKNSDTGRNRRIKFDTSSTSAHTEATSVDSGSGGDTTKTALTRALNLVQNTQVAQFTYLKGSKSNTAALGNESSFRKILLALKQSNSISAAADKDAHSPCRSPGTQTSNMGDNDVHSDYYRNGRKNLENGNEKRAAQTYNAESDPNDQEEREK